MFAYISRSLSFSHTQNLSFSLSLCHCRCFGYKYAWALRGLIEWWRRHGGRRWWEELKRIAKANKKIISSSREATFISYSKNIKKNLEIIFKTTGGKRFFPPMHPCRVLVDPATFRCCGGRGGIHFRMMNSSPIQLCGLVLLLQLLRKYFIVNDFGAKHLDLKIRQNILRRSCSSH